MKKRLTAADMHNAEVIAQTPWFSMHKVAIDVTDAGRRDFYSAHYPRPARRIVAMQQDKVLLIRHYRYLIDKVVWAIPSGGLMKGKSSVRRPCASHGKRPAGTPSPPGPGAFSSSPMW